MGNAAPEWRRAVGLDELRESHPGLVVRPGSAALRLVGEVSFSAQAAGTAIQGCYDVEILVPRAFPRELPRVFERGGRIPPVFHTNLDGTLCLGSKLRLLCDLAETPTLTGYADRCLIPYLFSHAYWERTGVLPWSDLAHGPGGLIQDYREMFKARDADAVVAILTTLAVRRRVANRLPCQCGAGRPLSACHGRELHPFRQRCSRKQFRLERDKIKKHLIDVRKMLGEVARKVAAASLAFRGEPMRRGPRAWTVSLRTRAG
jgi:hypothetical protein